MRAVPAAQSCVSELRLNRKPSKYKKRCGGKGSYKKSAQVKQQLNHVFYIYLFKWIKHPIT
jgi:hypothetical protein